MASLLVAKAPCPWRCPPLTAVSQDGKGSRKGVLAIGSFLFSFLDDKTLTFKPAAGTAVTRAFYLVGTFAGEHPQLPAVLSVEDGILRGELSWVPGSGCWDQVSQHSPGLLNVLLRTSLIESWKEALTDLKEVSLREGSCPYPTLLPCPRC